MVLGLGRAGAATFIVAATLAGFVTNFSQRLPFANLANALPHLGAALPRLAAESRALPTIDGGKALVYFTNSIVPYGSNINTFIDQNEGPYTVRILTNLFPVGPNDAPLVTLHPLVDLSLGSDAPHASAVLRALRVVFAAVNPVISDNYATAITPSNFFVQLAAYTTAGRDPATRGSLFTRGVTFFGMRLRGGARHTLSMDCSVRQGTCWRGLALLLHYSGYSSLRRANVLMHSWIGDALQIGSDAVLIGARMTMYPRLALTGALDQYSQKHVDGMIVSTLQGLRRAFIKLYNGVLEISGLELAVDGNGQVLYDNVYDVKSDKWIPRPRLKVGGRYAIVLIRIAGLEIFTMSTALASGEPVRIFDNDGAYAWFSFSHRAAEFVMTDAALPDDHQPVQTITPRRPFTKTRDFGFVSGIEYSNLQVLPVGAQVCAVSFSYIFDFVQAGWARANGWR